MQIFQNKSKVVMVATSEKGCPRVAINYKSAKFRDDYKGVLSTKKGLASLLFSRL
ncbi:MAG: hypothetical protein ACREBF_05080 [Candidatus Micrarchaeales archaeon]